MEKLCMFSIVLLWSLVGSVMGCWANSGTAARSRRAQKSTPDATRSVRTPTLSRKRGKDGAPTFLEAVGKRPTQAKAACVGHPHPAASVGLMEYPLPSPPPRNLVFMELRTVPAQSIE